MTFRSLAGGALVGAAMMLPLGCASTGAGTTSSTARFDPSSFSGTWTGRGFAVNSLGSGEVIQRLVLAVNADGSVKGSVGWSAVTDLKGHEADGDVTATDDEAVIGLASFTQGSLALVETEENGTLLARILPDGTLEVLRTQPGTEPVVTFALLSRESK